MSDDDRHRGQFVSQGFHLGGAGSVEILAQQQILGRVTTQRQFRCDHDIRPERFGSMGEIDNFGGVAGNVADRRIDLGNRYFERHRRNYKRS